MSIETEDQLQKLAERQGEEIAALRKQLVASKEEMYSMSKTRESLRSQISHLREERDLALEGETFHRAAHQRVMRWVKVNAPELWDRMQKELIFGE